MQEAQHVKLANQGNTRYLSMVCWALKNAAQPTKPYNVLDLL